MRVRGASVRALGAIASLLALVAALPAAAETPVPTVPGITVVPPQSFRPEPVPPGDGTASPPRPVRPAAPPSDSAPRRDDADDDDGASAGPSGCPYQKKKLELIV